MTFIGDFFKYLKTRTDAPEDFHVHAAVAALSYAMGSNVWCEESWSRPLRPNMWIAIIARSGMGKSAPLDFSQDIVAKAQLIEGLLPESFTQEALIDRLDTTPTGIFYLQEFSAFLSSIRREYNQGTEAFLTALYDVPDSMTRITRNKDKPQITLIRPCITIMAASSPDWFAESFKASSLRGGFLARFMFCPSNQPGAYVGLPGPRDMGVEAALADHLRQVHLMSGKFDFSKVRKQYVDWDMVSRKRVRDDCPPEFAGIRSRAGAMVLKASMIFHASADPYTMTIASKDVDQAIRYVEKTQSVAEKYLSEEVASDKYEVHRIKVLEIVGINHGHVAWSKALRSSHLSARDFRTAVDTLKESDRLQVELGIGKQKYLRFPEAPLPVVHTNGKK